jgi:hypothetical protein
MNKLIICAVTVATAATAANAAFTEYVIRSTPVIQPNTTYVPNGIEFITTGGGQKAALGSSNLDGSTIGDITQVAITRHDNSLRFGAGSGPAVAPYFNLWITDGNGNYAVIANEPSNPAFQALTTVNPDGSFTYDFDYGDLADKVAKVFETPGWNTGTSWVHNAVGSANLTFADLAGFVIEAPDSAYITNPANAVGTGAPDELGTNAAFGFNWVFGDTLTNYVSGQEGFIVSNPIAVPAPGAAGLLGLAGLAAARRRR